MLIGSRIKNRRKQLGKTQEDVAKIVGVTKQTIQKYENNIITNIPSDKIELMAYALNWSEADIMGWNKPNITDDVVSFPILGDVAAGFDHIALEDWEGDTIEIPSSYLHGRPQTDFFILRVKGDSMYPQYQDGDVVLVLKQSCVDHPGDVGVVIYDGEYATLKKIEFAEGKNYLNLVPINPEYCPKKLVDEELERCHIIGVPRALIRMF